MSPEDIATIVSERLSVPPALVRVVGESRHSPGARDLDVPSRYYSHWTVIIEGQRIPEYLTS